MLDGQSHKPQLEIIYIFEPTQANSQVVIGQKVPRIIKQQMTALKTIQNSSILDTDAEIAP